MASGESFEQHAAICPHVSQIEELYPTATARLALVADLADVPVTDQMHPAYDQMKGNLLVAELGCLYAAAGCDGPIDGSCPLLERKQQSVARKPFAAIANTVIRVITRKRQRQDGR